MYRLLRLPIRQRLEYTVGNLCRDSGRFPVFLGVDALDCASVPLPTTEERGGLGKPVRIESHQGHGEIKLAKYPRRETMCHCLDLGDVQQVYQPPFLEGQPSERGPIASPRIQSILVADERQHDFSFGVTRTIQQEKPYHPVQIVGAPWTGKDFQPIRASGGTSPG
jgi:hypothetical protein